MPVETLNKSRKYHTELGMPDKALASEDACVAPGYRFDETSTLTNSLTIKNKAKNVTNFTRTERSKKPSTVRSTDNRIPNNAAGMMTSGGKKDKQADDEPYHQHDCA